MAIEFDWIWNEGGLGLIGEVVENTLTKAGLKAREERTEVAEEEEEEVMEEEVEDHRSLSRRVGADKDCR